MPFQFSIRVPECTHNSKPKQSLQLPSLSPSPPLPCKVNLPTPALSRKKVRLQWIANDAARRATFKKRRRGLMKKVHELSILCNVKACAVVYGPYEPHPEVWPSTEEAAALLRGFRSLPEHEQSRRRMDQESFLRQRTEKLREQIEKEKKATREIQVELLMLDCLRGVRRVEDLSMEETTTLGCLVEMKLKGMQPRMEFLREQQQQLPNPAGAAATAMQLPSSQPPSFHMNPPSPPHIFTSLIPPVEYLQFSNSYLSPPLPVPQPPPCPISMEGADNMIKLQQNLHAPATSVNARAVQMTNHVDLQAAMAAAGEGERRVDWLMEMMGPYGHLFCDGEGLAPPPLVDDTKNSWMMDPYFPFN